MEQEDIYLGENGIIKSVFEIKDKNKRFTNINEVDIRRIKVSDKKSYSKDSFKYFIGYRHEGNTFPSPLCIKLPEMNFDTKYFDKNNKYINLLVSDKKILEKYSEIWNKIKRLIKKEFNSEPVYNDKYIKTKIKIYNDKVYTNFQHNKIPKDNEYCACLSVILLDSIFVNSNKEYYPQIFLEECKHAMKDRKIKNTINEDLKLSESDDESNDD